MKKRTSYRVIKNVVVMYLIGVFMLYFAFRSREIRFVTKEAAELSDCLLTISHEEIDMAKKACSCVFICVCARKYVSKVAKGIPENAEGVDVLLYHPYELNVIFKYGIVSSPYLAVNMKRRNWRRNMSLCKTIDILKYILKINIRYALRKVKETSSILSYLLAGILLIICYAPMIRQRKTFPFYSYLLSVGTAKKELVITEF